MFPCSVCGVCCQNIKGIIKLNEFDLGNGTCKHFDVTSNSCTIYDNRPDICQVEKMFEVKYNKYFTKEEFYIENAKACNSLQVKYGIDENFRINIKE